MQGCGREGRRRCKGETPGSNVASSTQSNLFGVIPKLSGRRERMDFRTGSREARKWDGTLETRGWLKSAERGKEVRPDKLLESGSAPFYFLELLPASLWNQAKADTLGSGKMPLITISKCFKDEGPP